MVSRVVVGLPAKSKAERPDKPLNIPRPFSRCQRQGHRGRSGGLLRIHQYEGDAAWLLTVVEPGVIGRLLYDYIAGLEMDCTGIEHHVDLA